MSYITRLEKLGFTQKESVVYLASLRLGNARVSAIAAEADLPKSSTLDILRTLNSRGIVSRYKQKNRYYFAAADPSVIGTWIDRRQDLFQKILPSLEDLQYTADIQPSVRFFDDRKSFGTLEREILTQATTISIIGRAEQLRQHLPKQFPDFTKKRLSKKIPAQIILEDSTDARSFQEKDRKFLSQTRISKTSHSFDATLLLWNNKAAFISFSPKTTITIISDQNITQTLRSLFDLQWEVLSK